VMKDTESTFIILIDDRNRAALNQVSQRVILLYVKTAKKGWPVEWDIAAILLWMQHSILAPPVGSTLIWSAALLAHGSITLIGSLSIQGLVWVFLSNTALAPCVRLVRRQMVNMWCSRTCLGNSYFIWIISARIFGATLLDSLQRIFMF
jgi:hypothetical protein